MYKQLSYFYSMENELSKLAESSQKINGLLFHAYTPPDKTFCELNSQIDSIIAEEQQLQKTLSIIQVQVFSNSFLPEKLGQTQLLSLGSSITTLPIFFSAVLQQQYATQRKTFNLQIVNIFRMHQLPQKRKTLAQQSQNLNALLRRTKTNSTGLNTTGIMNQATLLRDRIKHVRKSYQYFCAQVARKINDWIHEIAQKCKNFNNNTPKMPIQPFNKYEFKREAYLNTSNRDRKDYGRLLQTSKYHLKDQTLTNFLQMSKKYGKMNLSDEFHGVQNSKNKNSNIQRAITSNFNKKVQYEITRQYQTSKYLQKAADLSRYRKCQNHKAASPDFHRHTCNIRQNTLGRVKSLNNFHAVSPKKQQKFDYRKVIDNNYI